MHKDISPEEKLLALIKGKGKKEDAADPKPASDAAASRPAQAEAAEKNKRDYVSEIFVKYFSKNELLKPAFLKHLNRYLTAALIALFVYFVTDIFFAKPYEPAGTAVLKEPEAKGDTAPKKETLPPAKDYSRYAGEISGKKIFGQAAGTDANQGAITTSDDVANMIGLVGILAGDDPQAILEDKKDQKTYYLKKGESFNNFVVEEISDGKVVVDYEGRKITLFL